MAKSARASRLKSNKSLLRRKVFGPVVDARTERLSEKLHELATQPKPETQKMHTDTEENREEESGEAMNDLTTSAEDMEIDGAVAGGSGTRRKQKSKKNNGRIHKKSHRKVQNSMTFPRVKQRRTVSRVSKKNR